jgi:hypothetical protein
MAFHRHAADCIDRVEKAGVLHHKDRFLPRGIKAGRNRDTLIFLADLHHFEFRIGNQPFEQVMARDAIGQGHNETDARTPEFIFNRLRR